MAWVAYDKWMEKQWNGAAVDLDANSNGLKIALCTVSYVPDSAADNLWTDAGIQSNEVSGTNYVAGGASTTDTVTRAANLITFDGSDVTWSQNAGGFTNGRIAVLYETTTNKLIAYEDMGASKGNVAGDLTVAFDAAGALTVARA